MSNAQNMDSSEETMPMDLSPLTCTAEFYIKLSDVGQALPLLQRLSSSDEQVLLDAVSRLRLTLTCNQQQKLAAVQLDLPQRLLSLLATPTLAAGALRALTSLTAAGAPCVAHLLQLDILPALAPLLGAPGPLGEAALACVQGLLHHGALLPQLTDQLRRQTDVLQAIAGRMEESVVARQLLCEMLCLVRAEGGEKMTVPAGVLLSMLLADCLQTKRAALMYMTTCLLSDTAVERLFERDDAEQKGAFGRMLMELMSPDEEPEIRLLACTALALGYQKSLLAVDYPFVVQKLVPALARLCRKDQLVAVRVSAAESITLVIDGSPELQEYASFTDQLPATLADYLRPPAVHTLGASLFGRAATPNGPGGSLSSMLDRAISMKEASNELKRAAFLAFSALAASSETIRKRIADMDGVISAAVSCATLDDGISGQEPGVLYAALRFLLSLSRSVQQLRTVFKEHNVWETALAAMKEGSGRVGAIASAIVANLSVEFSPNQHNLMKKDVWAYLGTMLSSPDDELVLNAIWTLMNMTYMSPASVKRSVLEIAPVAVVEELLASANGQIQSCTVGLLRNLLYTPPLKESSPPPGLSGALALSLGLTALPMTDMASRLLRRQRHSLGSAVTSASSSGSSSASSGSLGDFADQQKDAMECKYCQELLRCLLAFLAASPGPGLQEQAFCALANVCASGRGQQLILHNPDALGLLKRALQHPETPVQRAVVACVANLARTDEDGYRDERTSFTMTSTERQRILIDNNFQVDLRRLMFQKDDSQLFDRVKTALQYLGGN